MSDLNQQDTNDKENKTNEELNDNNTNENNNYNNEPNTTIETSNNENRLAQIKDETDDLNDSFDNMNNYSNCNKHFTLLVVSIALLLDGMLNMVILPIIPEYLKYLPNSSNNDNQNQTHGMFDYNRNDVAIGFLFASKPFIQLVISPFSGTLIDTVGYEMPMFVGLIIQFVSTMVFTYTDSLVGLFVSRSLQGVGSALAATSGFTMIAYFFRTHFERSKALGFVITSLALGSFMSVPFSGFLFQYVGKKSPFIVLASLAMFDSILLLISIYKNCNTLKRFRRRRELVNSKKAVKKKYIWTLFLDPYIAICSVSLIMANVPLAFTEPTIAIWMKKTMNATESEIGLIWLSGFLPHLFGVYLTVFLIKYFSQHQWLFIIIGLVLEAVSCLSIPFITSYSILFLPICIICFGYGLIDATILPTMAFLVDTRHSSLYGSVYAIVDISYSLVYAFGPMVAGVILNYLGFMGLSIIICIMILLFTPLLYLLKKIYLLKLDYEIANSNSVTNNSPNSSQGNIRTISIINQSYVDDETLSTSRSNIISKNNNNNYIKFH